MRCPHDIEAHHVPDSTSSSRGVSTEETSRSAQHAGGLPLNRTGPGVCWGLTRSAYSYPGIPRETQTDRVNLCRRRSQLMPLVSMRQLLDEAAKGGYGVGAFNVNNMEQIQSIMEAARETKSPVIVQASRGARSYSNDRFLYHLMIAATEVYPEIPTVLHLDHGNSVETCKSAIEMGFTSVMMDGSLMPDGKTPSSFEYNVKATREVVEMAHARGVTVEGEIGCLGGIEDGHGAGLDGLAHLTDPDEAVEFVHQTGVDALAIAIGTSHGAYKFDRAPTGETLKMER